MAGKISIDGTLADAAKIVDVWTLNPDFTLGSIPFDEVTTLISELKAFDAQVETKRTELSGLVDQRDDKAKALAEIVTRAKSGIRAVYGPDSPQYGQAGGTRKSERKSPARRAPLKLAA